MRKIVELNFGGFIRICTADMHIAARTRAHGSYMKLKAMSGRRGTTIIAYGYGQKMILNIWIGNSLIRADKAKRFKLV